MTTQKLKIKPWNSHGLTSNGKMVVVLEAILNKHYFNSLPGNVTYLFFLSNLKLSRCHFTKVTNRSQIVSGLSFSRLLDRVCLLTKKDPIFRLLRKKWATLFIY